MRHTTTAHDRAEFIRAANAMYKRGPGADPTTCPACKVAP